MSRSFEFTALAEKSVTANATGATSLGRNISTSVLAA